MSPAATVEPTVPAVETTTPPPAPAPRSAQADTTDDVLPIAGAAGAAILLIGGGLFAMRRRRRDEDEVYVADSVATPVEPVEPVATFEQPGYAAPPASPVGTMPVARAETIDAPATALPAGFDTSRFGRHTQAAYRGPTPENPSLSLKRRLKRASFMDQRERMATENATRSPQAASAPSPQPAQAPRQTEHVTTRIKTPPRPGFRPAWQG